MSAVEQVKIVRAVSATDSEWDQTWKACGYSTYFHSREWSDVWSRAEGPAWSPDARHIQFDDGRSALLVGSSRRLRFGGSAFVTSPEGTFGGWLSLDDLTPEHGRAMVRFLRTHFSLVRWRANPRDPSLVGVDLTASNHDITDDVTHVLNLDAGYDALSSTWAKSVRYRLRKSRREGVETRLATTDDDWHQYFEVYLDARSRWGDRSVGPMHDYTIFDNFRKLASSNVELLVAEHDGAIVAGGLFLSSQSHTAYWHAATKHSALKLSPMNLVLDAAIARACESPDCEWFDFLPSAQLAGVESYKESFRSTRVPAPYVRIARGSARARKFAHKLWRPSSPRQGASPR